MEVHKKITIGVCVMEKKVKCGSEVLFLLHFFFFFFILIFIFFFIHMYVYVVIYLHVQTRSICL